MGEHRLSAQWLALEEDLEDERGGLRGVGVGVCRNEDGNFLGAGLQLAGEIRRHAILPMAQRLGGVVLGAKGLCFANQKQVAQGWSAGGAANFESRALRAGFATVVV